MIRSNTKRRRPRRYEIAARAARITIPLLLLSLLSTPRGQAAPYTHLPQENSDWPLQVFADLDSFSTRYGEFHRAHFGDTDIARLPTWLELDVDSLSFGDHVLTRQVPVVDNDEAILQRLLDLVSMGDEIGMTQFGSDPDFPSVNFVLGHRDGALTLVPYDARGIKEPLEGLDVIGYLKERRAFLVPEAVGEDLVVFTRGNRKEVDIWYPRLAGEVLHTHTIPGNINPTGYLEFFEGSDRDIVMSSYKFQNPIKRYVLPRKQEEPPPQ